jgi:hypothetical protein
MSLAFLNPHVKMQSTRGLELMGSPYSLTFGSGHPPIGHIQECVHDIKRKEEEEEEENN